MNRKGELVVYLVTIAILVFLWVKPWEDKVAEMSSSPVSVNSTETEDTAPTEKLVVVETDNLQLDPVELKLRTLGFSKEKTQAIKVQ